MTARPKSYIHSYASPLGNGRAIMHVDVVIDGKLDNVLSYDEGSPAPIETVRAHESFVVLDDS